MFYLWWLYAVLTPIVMLDIALRASPFYVAHWPLGFDYLPDER